MAVKQRINGMVERILEGNQGRSGSRLGTLVVVLVASAVGAWTLYSIFFMPAYQSPKVVQPVAYSSGAVREIALPVEQPPPPPVQRQTAPPPPLPPPPVAQPRPAAQPKKETLAEKCRRMARLHSQYSGPFAQAWKVSDCNPDTKAEDAETKPQQVMEIPAARQQDHRPGMLQPPPSSNMVMQGSVIPVALAGEFDTQVPGQATAIVTQDVRDTRTGKNVLIPHGSKVIGRYDLNLPYDQNVVKTAWQRLILPNGEYMDLMDFPGAGRNGAAGLPVEVNTHFWKMIGRSLLRTITGAGAEYARHSSYNGSDYNFSDALGQEGGQELDRRSNELWNRGGYRGPTGTAKAGEVFLLQVTNDMEFPPGSYYERVKGVGYAATE